jgi:catechol 2,3-dioxygenase-like lactoylglutathione lyase family enzyme
MPIAHFTLATPDLRRARDFFAAAFGWKPIERPSNVAHPTAWLEVAPGQEIHLVEVPDFKPSGFEREYGRHIAVFHPHGDFAALKRRLVERGAELKAPLRETPFERFFFRDPDGYFFEVIEEPTADRERD